MKKCKLEVRTVFFEYLRIIKKAYESGDFEKLFSHLADDCVFESQWVMMPNTGIDAVKEYLIGKGETLKRKGCFPSCSIAQLLKNSKTVHNVDLVVNNEKTYGSVALLYDPGELCLLMSQKLKDKVNETILRIKLNDEYKISRIDLCMPELFEYTDFYTEVALEPAKNGVVNEDALIWIGEHNYPELYMFSEAVDEYFNEYDDSQIAIDKWLSLLECWKRFIEFPTFDEAFEDFAGVDYSDWSKADKSMLQAVSSDGHAVWDHAKEFGLLYELYEWTMKYKDTCDHINITGF